jgi:hypothetical protein
MTTEPTPARRAEPPAAPPPPAGRAQAFVRALTERSPWLLPLAVVVGAATLGALRGASAAILTLAGGTLLGVIMLLWKALQVLVGDAPLSLESALDLSASGGAQEQKQAILRALKDLDHERGLGKLSDEDYRDLAARYRAEAKALLRSIDDNLGPARERAERLIESHLAPKKAADKPKKKKKRAETADLADGSAADLADGSAADLADGSTAADAPAPADEPAPARATDDPGETAPRADAPARPTSPPAGDEAAPRNDSAAPAAAPLVTPPAPAAASPVTPPAPAAASPVTPPAPADAPPAAIGAEPAISTVASPSCPDCGTRNDADASFCKACGARLQLATAAAAAAATAPSEP